MPGTVHARQFLCMSALNPGQSHELGTAADTVSYANL